MGLKIILSRKGVDTNIGKIASPILEDGQMISLPIPVGKDDEKTSYKKHEYTQMIYEYTKFKEDLSLLEPRDLKEDFNEKYCHYDPDLRERTISGGTWKASLGQCGPNATKLKSEYQLHKDKDEFIFLFFGRFHFVKEENGKYKYVMKRDISKKDKNYKCKDIHAIWGYLVVNEMVDNEGIKLKFFWHPHAADYYTKQDDVSTKNNPNIIFSGNGGVLDFNEARILTKLERNNKNKDISMAIWDKNKFISSSNEDALLECLKDRKNSASEEDGELFFKGQWQELILNFEKDEDANEFLKKLDLKYDKSNRNFQIVDSK